MTDEEGLAWQEVGRHLCPTMQVSIQNSEELSEMDIPLTPRSSIRSSHLEVSHTETVNQGSFRIPKQRGLEELELGVGLEMMKI